MVQFAEFTGKDFQDFEAIIDRAVRLKIYARRERLDCSMDISAAYVHCPLRLDDLLAADNFNFAHDVAGIKRHINRKTGKLESCFLPRFAKPE